MSTKKCRKTYCEKVYLPMRENVDRAYAKERKLSKAPIDQMRPALLKTFRKAIVDQCQREFCDAKCGFAKTIDEKRRANLKKKGALGACRDLQKEHPKYYKKNV